MFCKVATGLACLYSSSPAASWVCTDAFACFHQDRYWQGSFKYIRKQYMPAHKPTAIPGLLLHLLDCGAKRKENLSKILKDSFCKHMFTKYQSMATEKKICRMPGHTRVRHSNKQTRWAPVALFVIIHGMFDRNTGNA